MKVNNIIYSYEKNEILRVSSTFLLMVLSTNPTFPNCKLPLYLGLFTPEVGMKVVTFYEVL